MPKLRTKPSQRTDSAIEELEAMTEGSRGIAVVRSGHEQVMLSVGREGWPARVIVRDAVSKRDAQVLVETESRGSKIIVANQLSADAKDVITGRNVRLRTTGWSWLDRRGELQLNHPRASGIIQFGGTLHRTGSFDGSALASPRSDGPIRGRAGISSAASLLLRPNDPPSIRAIAREAQMSHGAIGEAIKLLRGAGLILPSGQPAVPDLFWALSAIWNPTRVTPVAALPTAELAERLHANPGGPDIGMRPGWCLGGDESAMAWGAPMFALGVRPRIWVPEEGDARRLERVLGASSWETCAAIVAVPPTAIVCVNRVWAPPGERALPFLPTAHPVFLALELAQDPSRGREILDQWHPKAADVQRVW